MLPKYLKALLFDCRAGIRTLGLYRIGGVNSKVQKLMTTVFCKLHLQPFTPDVALALALGFPPLRRLFPFSVLLADVPLVSASLKNIH